MWDVVRGVVQGKLGAIKEETQKALEAEATNNHVKAFLLYRQSLDTTDWEEEPLAAEVRLSLSTLLSCSSISINIGYIEIFIPIVSFCVLSFLGLFLPFICLKARPSACDCTNFCILFVSDLH